MPLLLNSLIFEFCDKDFFISNSKGLEDKLRDLAMAAQKGDKTAYAEFLKQLYPFIAAILNKKLGGIVDSEDVTQECLVGVHRNLASYHPSKPIKPWIYAIIRYKVADYFRVMAKRKEVPLADSSENVTKTREAANSTSEDSAKDIERVLASLPEKLKRALVMTHLEGLSYPQTAAREGIKEAALRKRISRAYKELRKSALGDMIKDDSNV